MRKSWIYGCLFFSFICDFCGATLWPCPTPSIRNGRIRRRQRGKLIQYVCNPGFLLAGERFNTCRQGRWESLAPKCVRPTCKKTIQPPSNAYIYPSHSTAALHFFCKSGFELRGPSDIYCDGLKWDNNPPSCLPTNQKPKLFCDFEAEDICNWTHDVNHDFDWRRENFNTPSGSIGTGPSFDHTKGQGSDGYYMYIESSSRNENDTAKLISPIFDKTDTETCLEFFYHMFGATTGSLNVYLKKSSEDWSLHSSRKLFSKSGNQGDKWFRSYHSLGPIDEDYQIVIEGIRGPGYVSDIAIDDVRIIDNCVYEDDFISTSTTDTPYSTEFLPVVESCKDRCGLKAYSNRTDEITCDCDAYCFFNSTCCPDYLDYCLAVTMSNDEGTTTDISNELIPQTTITTRILTTPSHIIQTDATKSSPAFSTTTTTTTTTTTRPTTIPRPIKKIIRPQPTVQILRPPTTPKIIKKLLPTPKPTKKVYVKPSVLKEEETNDVIDIPRETVTEKENITPASSEEFVSKEGFSDEIDNGLHGNYVKHLSESDKLFSQKLPESQNVNTVVIVVSVVGAIVLMTVISVYVVRKVRLSRTRMNCSSGDSQSDVRFLTSDEVLDFSLDRNYNDL